MYSAISSFLAALVEPADALLDPNKRVFGPFLLGSVLIAAAVVLARGAGVRRGARALFARRLWLHRSALADYRLLVVKAVLRAALFGSFGLSLLLVAGLTAGFLRRHVAAAPMLTWSPIVIGSLYTLIAFLVEDWSRFALHRLMHRVPLLWEFHKVHHSAEVLTPVTLYRTHPVETFLNGVRGALAVGLVTGVFAWTFGPGVRAWEILGIEAIGFVWTLFGANLRHSHVWVSYGRFIEHLLVSPAQHQVHHSTDARHIDRNFGTVLALWDWLGGSLYTTTRTREALRMGLPPGESPLGDSVASLLLRPLWSASQRVVRALLQLAATPARRRAIAALAIGALCVSACESKKLDRQELLTAFATCTLDRHAKFQAAADALVSAVDAWAANPNETARAAARTAWQSVSDVWQTIELLRYGPVANFDTTGGKALRDPIFPWPDVNRCLLEEQLVSKIYEGPGYTNLSVSTRGLPALEYLLFHPGSDNACAPAAEINTMGTWAALSPDELTRRKAAYAKAAAADVAAKNRDITTAWGAGGFREQLTTAGRGSTLFPTQQTAISAVGEALYFFDDVKDQKLGSPLGLVDCTVVACPAEQESPFALRGRTHLRNNVDGLETLLLGCEAGGQLGYDDLLVSVGASPLETELRDDLTKLRATIDALPGEDLKQVVATDKPAMQRVFDAAKELNDFLKMEFKTALGITAARVEGDHD